MTRFQLRAGWGAARRWTLCGSLSAIGCAGPSSDSDPTSSAASGAGGDTATGSEASGAPSGSATTAGGQGGNGQGGSGRGGSTDGAGGQGPSAGGSGGRAAGCAVNGSVVSDDTTDLGGPCTSSDCATTLTTMAGKLVVYRTHALGAVNPSITLAVIVVHGKSRNASDYFEYVVEAANDEGVMDTTAVIAPFFQEDATSSDELYWEDASGWPEGGDGTTESGGSLSTYAAVDDILGRLGDESLFPNLEQIVVTGHSAGGQFTQRYAAGQLSNAGCVPVRYVVANPSSYLYLNSDRFIGATWTSSAPELDSCAGYDDYKYGLAHREDVPYMANQSDADLIDRYVNNEVVYMLGTEDTCNEDLDSGCQDNSLDKTCPAMVQGDHRLQRGDRYYAFMNEYFAGHAHEHHYMAGVGHSGSDVYDSPEAKEAVFHGF